MNLKVFYLHFDFDCKKKETIRLVSFTYNLTISCQMTFVHVAK
jgi:hypothetical protein